MSQTKKNLLSRLFTASPLVLGTLTVLSGSALAQNQPNTLDQISEYGGLRNAPKQPTSFSQLTSVDQLRDVSPGSWAYEALRNLVGNYGCIVGYPDGTFRGNQALTRWEFAAGLNACLTYMERLIQENVALLREDIDLLKRLAKEFEAELAALGARVDNLESRVSFLEDHQFSTTTKLTGEVIFFVSGVFSEDEDFNDQATFSDRVTLNFDTSFTGGDRLRTRLRGGNIPVYEGLPLGFQFSSSTGNDIRIDDLIYRSDKYFNGKFRFFAAANGMDIDNDFSVTISPLDSAGSGAISEFIGDPSPYEQAFPGSGAGFGGQFTLLKNDSSHLRFDFGYIADTGEAANPARGNGLFNGPYATLTQLSFLNDFVDVGVMYSNSYDTDVTNIARIGRIYGDSGSGLGVLDENPASMNTYGIQTNFKITDTIEIGGGFAYTDYRQIGSAPDFNGYSYNGTLAIRDLGREGNLLGVGVGVPTYSRDLAPGTSVFGEVFYRLYVNDNISITPSIVVNTDPYNNDDNDTTVFGGIRTTFKF